MTRFSYKSDYVKSFDRLGKDAQILAIAADAQIQSYYETGRAPYGLRVKKIFSHGKRRLFEARASLSLRIVWAEEADSVIFVLLGGHDEVQRYLRNL